jgi:FkbM family methyltransferase
LRLASFGCAGREDAVRFTVTGDDGEDIEFECSNTISSRWVSKAILAGHTYPCLPFVDDVQVVADVGANCGAASVYFARHYPDATVHSFEPGSEPRAILERNAAPYPNVRVHPIGLHRVDDVLPLYKGRGGDTILGSIFRRDINADESEPVQLRAAGDWAAEHGIERIDVLESLAHLLATVKVLYVEYDSRQARRDIARMVDDTHDLYKGVLYLAQGECIYLRRDLADLDAAGEHLLRLLASDWTKQKWEQE